MKHFFFYYPNNESVKRVSWPCLSCVAPPAPDPEQGEEILCTETFLQSLTLTYLLCNDFGWKIKEENGWKKNRKWLIGRFQRGAGVVNGQRVLQPNCPSRLICGGKKKRTGWKSTVRFNVCCLTQQNIWSSFKIKQLDFSVAETQMLFFFFPRQCQAEAIWLSRTPLSLSHFLTLSI